MPYKLIHERHKCIHCGMCVQCQGWSMDNGTVVLDGAKYDKKENDGVKSDIGEKEIKDIGCNMEAAKNCPANCIHIKDIEKNKTLI